MFINRNLKKWTIKLIVLSAICLFFSASFTYKPLYTSNQNCYFLPGYYNAGQGLANDWIAKNRATTMSAAPIFHKITYLTYRYLHPNFFYLFATFFYAIYILCLIEIPFKFLNINKSKFLYYLCATVLILVHNTPLNNYIEKFSPILKPDLLYKGVATFYMLNNYFQPSTCNVLFLLSILFFLNKRYVYAVVIITLIVSIHPAVMSLGLSLGLSYIFIIYLEKKDWQYCLKLSVMAGLLVLPISIYSFIAMIPPSKEIYNQVLNIHCLYRASHHHDYRVWLDIGVFIKTGLIVVCLFFIRKSRFVFVVLIPFIFAFIGVLIYIITGNITISFLMPWRVSILIVPLSSAILIVGCLYYLLTKKILSDRYKHVLVFIASILLVIGSYYGITDTLKNLKQSISKNSIKYIMQKIRDDRSKGMCFLVPVKLQEFRLYTNTAVFIDYKTPANDYLGFLEWYERLKLSESFYDSKDLVEALRSLKLIQKKSLITHVLVPRDHPVLKSDLLIPKYTNDKYGAYKIRMGADASGDLFK
jgi:hypothetical protein